MLRISSAASGEELAALDASEFHAVAEGGATVAALKHHLAAKHFEGKYSRFQLRLLREEDTGELLDDESIAPPLSLQLILLKHLPPEKARDERFLKSCEDGPLDDVQSGLRALQDPNVTSSYGLTPLHLAAHAGHLDTVRILLEAGAKTEPPTPGATPLHMASRAGHLHIVQLLVDSGADKEAPEADAMRPLHLAVREGHLETVRLLLSLRADIEAQDKDGWRPLHVALFNRNEAVARLLVDSGAQKEAEKRDAPTASRSFRPP